ncbi:hypothetical protein [Nonomuraea basaltis]|uniref:hypothetical protein n=1 Tax=Nonomuraea basaltis TaxID=2495887 RepID=UPI00110C4523|nr:hypothetical protein [Nonomuraea basaltis]TMR93693.1 hypothetical protein EJK15_37870 [Nonomuraea basaltis]
MRWIVVAPLLLGVVAVAGCGAAAGERPAAGTVPSKAPATNATSAPSPSLSPVATGAGCNGTSVLLGDGFPEVQGTAEDAELWGLLFAKAPPPLPRGEEIKIVWRMTGEGPLQVRGVLPDGTRATLIWGPEAHGGSSWKRPGEEWGTGFVFPKRGCWKIELTRTRGSGHVWLPVR